MLLLIEFYEKPVSLIKVLDLPQTIPFQKFIPQMIQNFAKEKVHTKVYQARAELSEN